MNITFFYHHLCHLFWSISCPLEILCMLTFGFLTFIYLIISSIHTISNIFSLMLFITLPSPFDNSWHGPLHLWSAHRFNENTFFYGPTRKNTLQPRTPFRMFLLPSPSMLGFMFYMSKHMSLHFFLSTLWNNKLILCSPQMGSTLWLISSSSIPLKQI